MNPLNNEDVKAICHKHGAHRSGVTAARIYDELIPRLERRGITPFVSKDINKRINPFLIMRDAKSIIACAFPYRINENAQPGTAKYAAFGDYHGYIREKLRLICDDIAPCAAGIRFKVLVDSGKLCEKHIAHLAGVGYFGRNNLLYTDGIGPYFNIGLIITNAHLQTDKPHAGTCYNCGKCIRSCPGGALTPNYGMDVQRCISYISQIANPNTEQLELLQRYKNTYGYENVLGCDVCAAVCPLTTPSNPSKD